MSRFHTVKSTIFGQTPRPRWIATANAIAVDPAAAGPAPNGAKESLLLPLVSWGNPITKSGILG